MLQNKGIQPTKPATQQTYTPLSGPIDKMPNMNARDTETHRLQAQNRRLKTYLAVAIVFIAYFAFTPELDGPTDSASPPQESDLLCPVVRIIDGDTIDVLYRGREERVRLLRINTPERDEAGYDEATEAMRRLVEGKTVRLEFEVPGVEERGGYGRLLAYVFVGDLNVNVEMVRLGHSEFWTKYGRGRYAGEFEGAGNAHDEQR